MPSNSFSVAITKCCQNILFGFVLFGILAASPCPCCAVDDDEVRKAFEIFQNDWIVKLSQHGDVGENKVKVERDPQGRFIATYRTIAKDREYEVKATGNRTSPYVGVLNYEEQTFVNTAETPELAMQGPFRCERQVAISEIFRYSNGKWLY